MRYEILCELLMRSKLALVLIATGIFVPLVSIPFAHGYRQHAGLIENIHSMSFYLLPARYSPDFRASVDVASLLDTAPSPFSQNGGFTDAEVGLATPAKPPFDPSRPYDKPDKHVVYGKTRIDIYFPPWTSDHEIKNILASGKQQIESANSKVLRFDGWTVSRPGLQLPFSFVVSGSLILVFSGVIMLIVSRRPA